MSEFRKMIITNKGRNLIAKMINGTSGVQFTKMALSAASYSDEAIPALTSLGSVKQTMPVSQTVKLSNAAVKLSGAVNNESLQYGYDLKSIGVYAKDPDEGEILYSVASANKSGYVPAYNNITVSGVYITVTTAVSNASAVNLTVDPAAVATIGDIETLQNQISDLQAFIGYTEKDIYGVECDMTNRKFTRLAGAKNRVAGEGFNDIRAFGGRRRCNLTNDGKVVAYYGDPGFTTSGKLTQRIDLNDPEAEEADPEKIFEAGTIVQVMVEQPKFYYKVVPLQVEETAEGKIAKKIRYYVSDTPKVGFKVHPAFIENGHENDFIYLSAFEGSLWDVSASAYILDDAQIADFENDMLCSIANAKPISGSSQNLTRANTRKLAKKRGNGWEQSYLATASASQLLMMIEYCTFNLQSAIGMGNVNKPWKEDSINYSELTGATVNLGNASGAVTNDNGIQIVSYRGEENLWGNIWKWVDGINSDFNKEDGYDHIYIADHSFADDSKLDPYKLAEIAPALKSGYVSAFCYNDDFDWLFIPGEVNGNSSTPVGDYFYQSGSTGMRVAILGGGWNDGANDGPFYWYLHNSSGYRFRSISGRAVYVPSKNAVA